MLLASATDLRGQGAETPAQVSGRAQVQILQDTGGGCGLQVTIPAGLSGAPQPGTAIPFDAHLTLRGTHGLTVLPDARQVSVRMASASASPGFTGPNPPLHASVGPQGFEADWQAVGTSPVNGWQMDWYAEAVCKRDKAEGVGVELLQPVPTYLMVTRAAKYGTLFLVLAFLTYFLFERMAKVSIHVVQYALLGLSVSLFALLLVAVAEPLGFVAGYAVATAAVMGQASLYTLSVGWLSPARRAVRRGAGVVVRVPVCGDQPGDLRAFARLGWGVRGAVGADGRHAAVGAGRGGGPLREPDAALCHDSRGRGLAPGSLGRYDVQRDDDPLRSGAGAGYEVAARRLAAANGLRAACWAAAGLVGAPEPLEGVGSCTHFPAARRMFGRKDSTSARRMPSSNRVSSRSAILASTCCTK